MKRILIPVLLPALCQVVGAQAPSTPQRVVYEGVISDRGKTIGTTIMLETLGSAVSGWVRRHDFRPLETGSATDSSITFTSSGNSYKINLQSSRIVYSGPDGNGDQRVVKMEAVRGRVYRVTEESDYGRILTLQLPDGDREFHIERPSVWKRQGPPIAEFSRLEEIVGKTITLWRVRVGGGYSIEVIEEPEGVDLLAKLPKKKKEKERKK